MAKDLTPAGPETPPEPFPQRAAASKSAEQQLALRHRDARILVVEDDRIGQEILEGYLAAADVTVELAGDGVEALEKAARGRYDLILMDIQMPRMDGLDATRLLRQMPDYVHTPIIAVTAHAFAVAEQMAREAGMNGYLTKPLDPGALYALLLTWLDRSRDVASTP